MKKNDAKNRNLKINLNQIKTTNKFHEVKLKFTQKKYKIGEILKIWNKKKYFIGDKMYEITNILWNNWIAI